MYLRTRDGEWFKVSPYADSGVDITILPRSVCEILGLRLQNGQESVVSGVSEEEIKIFIHKITVRIGDEEFEIRAGFAEREDIPYLLGRTDILNRFNILFERDKLVFIKK